MSNKPSRIQCHFCSRPFLDARDLVVRFCFYDGQIYRVIKLCRSCRDEGKV
jgi:hypothetical protein